METYFNRAKLLVLLKDFYKVTGLRCVLFDEKGTSLLWYPEELPRFCRTIRTDPKGEPACFRCDQQACMMVKGRKDALIYVCHAGLIEVIAPVLVDDAVVGHLLLSHIVQGEDEEVEWAYVRERCKQYAVPMDELQSAYMELSRMPFLKLKAASDLLALAATAIYQQKLAWLKPDSPQGLLAHYLSTHFAEDLSSDRLCRELGMSRTSLYNLCKQTYGCSVSQQVIQLRVQRAVQLLQNTDLSNREICEAVGVHDYNYFYRIFRKVTGFPPRFYRDMRSEADESTIVRLT